ncbi:MAG: glucuronate isomerase [bacterium]
MPPHPSRKQIQVLVSGVLEKTPLVDLHTHLYDPALGPVLLWGIDELVTYHYLVAEFFRARPDFSTDTFWALSKMDQADLIWRELFVLRSPISEACRGVLTVLHRLGLETKVKDLKKARRYFQKRNARDYVDQVLKESRIKRLYMTNDPMDPLEAPGWKKGFDRDPRFLGVLRLDSAIMNWPEGAARLRAMGYAADDGLTGNTLSQLRRYLNTWCDRFDARYMAISLPPTFRYPDLHSPVTTLITKAVIPVAAERNIPVAMMIGVKKLTNPVLRLAGDSVGKSDIDTVEALARDFGGIRFLLTMLARENMHELCIAARKFKNITPFGCWWFLNNPSLIDEITRMRLETLGLSFVPQHSDARVLDQLIYKWAHSRAIIGEALADKYSDLCAAGWIPTQADIERDVKQLFDIAL